jgi:hypothetical protein
MLIKRSVDLPFTKLHDPPHNPNLTILTLIALLLYIHYPYDKNISFLMNE